MKRDIFTGNSVISFTELLEICESGFGVPVVIGDHYIFETPWGDDPLLSIQNDGYMAKPYQVRIVKEALEKLEAQYEIQ
ncbi:MAG: toxin HicA [Spirochaetae bacterium HGW-Spirochaetae-5]|nr:MAG: toxin HicA [Spirochaetae bacterium HGW-Spirochaetae-5]